MDEIVHQILRFDRFALDLTRGCLRLGEHDLELRPKAFQVLRHLVENAGRLVAKEELQKKVWGSIIVSDDSLVQCIRQLRRTLGDDAHRLIKTVSRRGYLLDTQVFDGEVASGEVPARSEKDAAPGERKLVTVLYADVKESLEVLGERDPEQALNAFETVVKLMTEVIHRYEGTVSFVAADGVCALFGAPLATEDHAERASYAALEIHQAVERGARETSSWTTSPPRVRIGLASGEVVIRPMQDGLQVAPRAMGPTMQAASRLAHRAAPGTTLIDQVAQRLAEGRVQVTAIAPAAVDAADGMVFKLVDVGPARTRFEARIARGLTPFVGRETELAQLDHARERAIRGHGQVVAIVGEAGVGKSRLVHELAQASRRHGWGVLESASVSYGKAMSYLPVIRLLKNHLGIKDSDSLEQIRQKVAAVLGALGEPADAMGPALLSLLDVPVDDDAWRALDAKQRRWHTLDAVKRLLLRDAHKQPCLLIFEDLHWIDSETQALLDLLIDSLGSLRLLLVVTYRLEYGHAWSTKTFYSQLRLDPLSSDRTAQFLDALLGEASELAPLKQRLVRRGNPFFLEETVRSLVETQVLAGESGRYRLTKPIDAFQVPPSVQTLLAARIDRLSAEDKYLLQVAAVLGKEAPYALLQAVADLPGDALHRRFTSLQAAEFLHRTQQLADPGYSFKHALTHEVAYAGLLHERRRQLHARIVDAVEQVYVDRLDEHIERLAHHALQGNLGEKALHYLHQAGHRAFARSAPQDARTWFERALGVLESLPETRTTLGTEFEIRYRLQLALNELTDMPQALALLPALSDVADRLGDDERRGWVCSIRVITNLMLGELDQGQQAASQGLEIAGHVRNRSLAGFISSYLVWGHYLRGEYRQAVDLATTLLASTPVPVGKVGPAPVWTRGWMMVSLSVMGDFVEAANQADQIRRIIQQPHNAHTLGIAYGTLAWHCLARGEWENAHLLNEQCIAAFQAGNVLVNLRNPLAHSALILARLGRQSQALERHRETMLLLERLSERAMGGNSGMPYQVLGQASLLLGRLDEAQTLAERALEASPIQFGFKANALHLLGSIAAHPDRLDVDRSNTYFSKALALATPRGMRPLIARCHLGLGKLCRHTGQSEQARGHLAAALSLYREMGLHWGLEQAEANS